MRQKGGRTGITLIEVLIAIVLVAVAASVLYSGVFYSYKTVMRSRARLEAQGIAFDKLWELYNQTLDTIMNMGDPSYEGATTESTPSNSIFSTAGTVRWAVIAETNPPVLYVDYWKIWVQVWASSNDPLFSVIGADGTVTSAYDRPMAEFTILRYRGDR